METTNVFKLTENYLQLVFHLLVFFPVLILIAYFFISASWMQHFCFSLSAIFHMHTTEKCSVLSEMSRRINCKENKKNPKNFVCCPSLRFCRETASSVFVYCLSLSALPKDKHRLRLCDKISVKWRVKMTVCVCVFTLSSSWWNPQPPVCRTWPSHSGSDCIAWWRLTCHNLVEQKKQTVRGKEIYSVWVINNILRLLLTFKYFLFNYQKHYGVQSDVPRGKSTPSASLKGNCAVNDLHRGLCVLYLAELPYPGSCSG